jgi:hypothetical protein
VNWSQRRSDADLPWDRAMPAIRDAWLRMFGPYGSA